VSYIIYRRVLSQYKGFIGFVLGGRAVQIHAGGSAAGKNGQDRQKIGAS
jgi:hypothetical protein